MCAYTYLSELGDVWSTPIEGFDCHQLILEQKLALGSI